MSILETLIAIGYLMVLGTMFWTPLNPTIGDSQRAVNDLDNTLLAASAAAQRYPDGVTIILSAQEHSTIATTFEHRPDQAQGYQVDMRTLPEPVTLPGGVTSYAFAIAPDGTSVLISPFTTWAAANAGGATCSTITATTGIGEVALPTTIDCATMRATF